MGEKKIKLALVGRPNVGKSALFNRICQKRIAIVDEAEGVTRDRLYADAEFFGRPFEVIDTAGINPSGDLPFQEEVLRQTEIAILEADVIVQVVDATAGMMPLDHLVGHRLLKTQKPVILAINKIDDRSQLDLIHEFYSLGIKEIVPVSAVHGFQIAELLEKALNRFPPRQTEEEDVGIKVAIVGRPNVGKSTLVNYLIEDERCVVSPIAGTTRDSIDIPIEVDGERFLLIDTAGIRRKKSEHEAVDKFAAIRTERAIERADVCVLLLDSPRGLTAQEKRIAREIEEQGKGCVLLFNKWDLVQGFRMEHCLKSLQIEASFLAHCPVIFGSALTGRNLGNLFPLIKKIQAEQTQRITTGQLNSFVEKVIQNYHPPMIDGKRLRIYYMTQVGVHPPHFVLFVNRPELMLDTYKKYMVNQFREAYGFTGVPLLFSMRGKEERSERSKQSSAAPISDTEPTEEELASLDPSYYL